MREKKLPFYNIYITHISMLSNLLTGILKYNKTLKINHFV
jgi:hypothetical protein